MSLPTLLAFDEFEFRLDSGELFRGGSLVTQLQPQPARLLELLASRTGEVVGREEIRQSVWGDSFVDFDASLNFCVKQIRRALVDSATSPRYIETLPRRGYRFLQPVRSGSDRLTPPAFQAVPDIAPETVPEAVPAPLLAPVSPPPAPRAGWRLLTGLAATLAALVLLVFLIASRFPQAPLHPRLTVFPLACQSRNPADRPICGGVTEALTAEVTRRFPRDLEVIAPTSTLVYQGSRKSAWDIGKELGATHLLTGTVETSSGRLHITARLRTTGGTTLWKNNFDGDLMDTPRVYEQITRRVALTLKLPLPAAPASDSRPSREASEAYLRGIYLRSQWKFEEAVTSLDEAVLLAPRFAPAYAALALSRLERKNHTPREDAPASRAAAQRALQLDPRLPEAHLAMANVLFMDLLDWGRAGAEYQQALLLSPGNAEILHAYASYLVALGRYDEAIDYVSRARELDPASMEVQSDYAWFFYLARRYDEAFREARETLSLLKMTRSSIPPIADYGQAWAYSVLAQGSFLRGDERTVLSLAKEKMRALGKSDTADRIRSMQDLLEWRLRYYSDLAQKQPGNYSYNLAMANAAMGRTDEALTVLEQDCRNGGEGMIFNYVAVEPMFESLHGDPRFTKIVDCTRLPQDAPARAALQVKLAAR